MLDAAISPFCPDMGRVDVHLELAHRVEDEVGPLGGEPVREHVALRRRALLARSSASRAPSWTWSVVARPLRAPAAAHALAARGLGRREVGAGDAPDALGVPGVVLGVV